MADDVVAQSNETQCGGGSHANSVTVKNNVHGNMASRNSGNSLSKERLRDPMTKECYEQQVTLAKWADVEAHQARTEDEWPSRKDLRPSEWRPLDEPMNGPLEKGKEREDETETETLGQCLWPSEQTLTPSAEDLWPSGKETSDVSAQLEEPTVESNSVVELLERVVAKMKRTIVKPPMMPSCQLSSGIVDFDCGKGSSTEEPKTAELSVADLLSDRIDTLLKYSERKMTKYAEPELARSYVELVVVVH
ncbi:hypothetical protein AXG93_4361s1000 [Marchantia polymorpha subsp. ruderalis]|uniref:Uncharacterized protein n=1 Tax=Marchantia polymorpha subsp. ruderalis TaxID=1480154 RepID=A0A176WKT3_MARPO|nr:hypothetical protein AXG93_4361s1000 [Marchantia polymorpha subsp. ruderalis]